MPNMAQLDAAAQKYIGIPYVLGGDGVSGCDCGLFTQMVFGDVGVTLNSRCADDQAAQMQDEGIFSEDINEAVPGDLIFFKNTYGDYPEGTITHVGIFAGDGQLLQCACTKGCDYTSDLQGYWMDYFAGIGKVADR